MLGLHNKPKAAVHSVHKLAGPKKKTTKTKKKKKKMMMITCQLIVVHGSTTLYCSFQFPKQCRLSILRNEFSHFERKL